MKVGGRNTNNLIRADDTILLAKSSNDLTWFLMKVGEESATAGPHVNIKKTKIMTTEENTQPNIDNEDVKIVKDYSSFGSVIH